MIVTREASKRLLMIGMASNQVLEYLDEWQRNILEEKSGVLQRRTLTVTPAPELNNGLWVTRKIQYTYDRQE